MKRRWVVFGAALMITAGVLTGCLRGKTSKTQETATTQAAAATEEIVGEETVLLLAAAASLKNAYEEQLIPMFEEQNPNIRIEGTYDSSGKLQIQIEEGLEADIFMSAATKQMTALEEQNLVDSETIVNLLENKIVLIVPSGTDDTKLAAFEDITKADSIALGDLKSVPAGQYAKEALSNLGIWEEIQPKVSLGTNVTEVLNQVASASADAGIVYATDAYSMEDQVTIVADAPSGSLDQKVLYPIGVLNRTKYREEAEAFLEFLQRDEAMKVFESYGFVSGE